MLSFCKQIFFTEEINLKDNFILLFPIYQAQYSEKRELFSNFLKINKYRDHTNVFQKEAISIILLLLNG